MTKTVSTVTMKVATTGTLVCQGCNSLDCDTVEQSIFVSGETKINFY